MIDEDSCNICDGVKSTTKNPIIFCDGKGCDMPVHKRCYRVQVVPKGEWFCERCECKRKKKYFHIICCPTQTGAIKKTNLPEEYMHVVCALWNKSIEHDKDSYSVPETLLGTRKCYFCSKKQGLCVQCEEPNCTTNFHVTCAINNSLITPAATVPTHTPLRCVQHEIESTTNALKRRGQSPESSGDSRQVKKRHTSPNSLFPEDQESSDGELKLFESSQQTEDSDDDMGTGATKKKKLKIEEILSYRERLDAKRKKEIKSSSEKSPVTTTAPPTPSTSKPKLPNKPYFNNTSMASRPTTPTITKSVLAKGFDEAKRWNANGNNNTTPQPTTPNLVNTPFFENEATKGQRKSTNGMDELSKLKEENKRLLEFKKSVSLVIQGLNVPIPGTDPANDIEQYINQLQSLMKRVGIISDEERRQIHESIIQRMFKK